MAVGWAEDVSISMNSHKQKTIKFNLEKAFGDEMKKLIVNNKGLSIVEVLVSMILLAFICLFVATFLTFHNKMLNQAKETTEVLYDTQDMIEQKNQTLLNDIKINNSSAYTTKTYSLFGKSVSIKIVSASTLNADNSVALKIDTGISSTYFTDNSEPNLPKLSSVDVKVDNNIDRVIYFPTDTNMAEVTYINVSNPLTNLYKNVYQWYVAPTNIHSIPLVNYASSNSISPVFPWNFDIISLQNQKKMPGTDIVYPIGVSAPKITAYLGSFLACAVTPGSREGYMGDTSVDMIYVSALPKLKQGTYKMLIDPSLTVISLPVGFSGTQYQTKTIASEKPVDTITSQITSSSNVVIQLDGANTSDGEDESYSRYIQLGSTSMSFSGLSNTQIGIYAVARSSANTSTSILTYTNPSSTILGVGNFSNQTIIPAFTDRKASWYIAYRTYSLADATKLRLSGNALDVAELIIVQNPSGDGDDSNAIVNYLQHKYNIGVVEED